VGGAVGTGLRVASACAAPKQSWGLRCFCGARLLDFGFSTVFLFSLFSRHRVRSLQARDPARLAIRFSKPDARRSLPSIRSAFEKRAAPPGTRRPRVSQKKAARAAGFWRACPALLKIPRPPQKCQVRRYPRRPPTPTPLRASQESTPRHPRSDQLRKKTPRITKKAWSNASRPFISPQVHQTAAISDQPGKGEIRSEDHCR